MPRYRVEHADRPGRVTAVRGIVFQNDGRSTIGRLLIRPLEALDRWVAGVFPPGDQPLAIHAGIHVEIDGAREFVAEQLVGTLYMDFRSGLNWTPLEAFRQRDRGGWDVTVPATAFRGVDDGVLRGLRERLDAVEGHPFVGEDCTAFIERAFGGRRLFADSPLLQKLGIGVRVGDPALPLLSPTARLDPRADGLLQAQRIRNLPDALASHTAPNARLWLRRLVPTLAVAGLVGYSLASRRSTPASRTARKFFR